MLPITIIWMDPDKAFVDGFVTQHSHEDKFIHFGDSLPETLERVDWSAIDAVFLDHLIKPVDGFDIIRLIRQKKENLPVLMLTSYADKEICIRAINAGINGFFEKPITAENFLGLVNRFRPKGFTLKICPDRKAIFSQNKWVDLTSTEYKILETLKTAKRRVTRSELQAAVWPSSSISENNLDTHLTNLKRKVPELNSCLNVKRGLGYFLDLKMAL